jgi:hypothetical protein
MELTNSGAQSGQAQNLRRQVVIRVLLAERIQKTAHLLPPDARDGAAKAITEVGAAFGDPH